MATTNVLSATLRSRMAGSSKRPSGRTRARYARAPGLAPGHDDPAPRRGVDRPADPQRDVGVGLVAEHAAALLGSFELDVGARRHERELPRALLRHGPSLLAPQPE